MANILRERATAVVIREDRVLLVHGKGGVYVMPGGGVEAGELPSDAVARELLEETGLRATRVEFLFEWESAIHRHHAFLIEAGREVEPGEEIESFLWWDRRQEIRSYAHVDAILSRLDGIE